MIKQIQLPKKKSFYIVQNIYKSILYCIRLILCTNTVQILTDSSMINPLSGQHEMFLHTGVCMTVVHKLRKPFHISYVMCVICLHVITDLLIFWSVTYGTRITSVESRPAPSTVNTPRFSGTGSGLMKEMKVVIFLFKITQPGT